MGKSAGLAKGALEVLRSPAGYPLHAEGDELVCSGTGRRYPVENGTPLLYDRERVSPILQHDYEWFANTAEVNRVQGNLESRRHHTVYERGRFLNTEFLFSSFAYAGAARRRVLEIGVGDASLLQRFARAGFEAWGLDFFPFEMDTAREADPGAPLHTVAAPMSRLPFHGGSFDVVYLHAALHHALPDDPARFAWSSPMNLVDALREIRRVLKPRDGGGAFFLLGEGLYPEDIRPDERHYELACQRDPDCVYEAWYTRSEYELAFEVAGLYPNVFSNQEGLAFQAHAYTSDGRRLPLADRHDQIGELNYGQVAGLFRHRLGTALPAVLPSWIVPAPLAVGQDCLAPLLTPPRAADGPHIVATVVDRGVFPGIGRFTVRDGVPWFQSELPGYLVYGPYACLPPGHYLASVMLEAGSPEPDLVVDVAVGGQAVVTLPLRTGWRGPRLLSLPFELPAGAENVEMRVVIQGPQRAACVAAVAFHRVL